MLTYRTPYSFRIFLLAMAMLILEVAFTRIFSFITYHHLTYFVISIAMMGFGAAGTYLTVRKREREPDESEAFLARNAALFGFLILVAIVIIPRIRFYPEDILNYGDYSSLISLLLMVLLSASPFFFGGVSIVHIIS